MKAQALEMQNDSFGQRKYLSVIVRNIVELIDKSHFLILTPMAFLIGKSTILNGGIPFSGVMFCGVDFLKTSKLSMFIMMILGMISKEYNKYVYINSICIVLFTLLKKILSLKDENMLSNALLCTLCLAIGEYTFFYKEGMLLYDFVKILFHLVLVIPLFYVFRNTGMYLMHKNRYLDIRNEEIMSAAIVTAISVLGISTLKFMGFKVLDVIITLLICMFSNKFGLTIGATFGMVLGLITNIHNDNGLFLAGLYSFNGMFSGTFKSLGKIGTSLGFFISNFMLMVFSNNYNPSIIHVREMLVGIIIFFVLPNRFIEFIIGKNLNSEIICWERRNYNFRLKELTVNKLNNFSKAFNELQKTFSKISEYEFVADKNDISILFDRVADRVCKNCSLCVYCWDRSFYETYQVMYKIVEMLEDRGRIEISDIPKFFLDRCERVGEFTRALNNIYEIFKVDVVWKNKIAESRKVVSKQLDGLSKVVSDLADEINVDVKFNTLYEESILNLFNKANIQCIDVMVYYNKWNKCEVIVVFKIEDCQNVSSKDLENLISDVINKKMLVEKESYKDKTKSIKFVQQDKLQLTTGFAKLTKDGQTVSGDSYSLLNGRDGKFYIVLSDGMGSGERALKNSNATINLFENFIECGFDKETTIKIINSILVLKSNEESFSTLDISSFDMNTGECEFIKIGAMPTFIKSKDSVKEIKYASLPAGILSSIEIEPKKEMLKSGDYIIMMTDGIMDSIKKVSNNEIKIKDLLIACDKLEPKEIAWKLVKEALKDDTIKPLDDMLVVVSKVVPMYN